MPFGITIITGIVLCHGHFWTLLSKSVTDTPKSVPKKKRISLTKHIGNELQHQIIGLLRKCEMRGSWFMKYNLKAIFIRSSKYASVSIWIRLQINWGSVQDFAFIIHLPRKMPSSLIPVQERRGPGRVSWYMTRNLKSVFEDTHLFGP